MCARRVSSGRRQARNDRSRSWCHFRRVHHLALSAASGVSGHSGLARFSPSPLPGREGLGVGAAEALGGLRQNMLGGTLRVREHVGVPKSKDPPTFGFQIFRTSPIGCCLFEMLAAVELDPEACLAASEVDDEGRNYQLTGESRSVTRDQMPNRLLGRRRIVAQFAGASGQFRIDAVPHVASVARLATLANPPPTPPLQGGARRMPTSATGAKADVAKRLSSNSPPNSRETPAARGAGCGCSPAARPQSCVHRE